MDLLENDFIYYSSLYTVITVIFAMAILSKFLTKDCSFGFRSFLSLVTLFIGEPICQFFLKGSSGVFIFGVACCLIYYILPSDQLPVSNKTVLITGCDSGFGFALAKKLDGLGMKVFAGCLYSEGLGAVELQRTCSQKLHILQLDVTNDQQLLSAYEIVSENVKEEGLWGLVNNAGVAYLADLDMTSEKIMRNIMEVNLFGMVRITKRFLPLVRKSQGRIINLSSLAGLVAFPGFGIYGMSKSAIEKYSDCLRMEMKKWGISVSIIEPVAFRTGGVTRDILLRQRDEIWASLDEDVQQLYGRDYLDSQYDSYIKTGEKLPTDYTSVTNAIQNALLSKRPQERYPVGRGALTLPLLASVLPVKILDKLIGLINSVKCDPATFRQ